jgi:flagellar hook-length control protein FliK
LGGLGDLMGIAAAAILDLAAPAPSRERSAPAPDAPSFEHHLDAERTESDPAKEAAATDQEKSPQPADSAGALAAPAVIVATPAASVIVQIAGAAPAGENADAGAQGAVAPTDADPPSTAPVLPQLKSAPEQQTAKPGESQPKTEALGVTQAAAPDEFAPAALAAEPMSAAPSQPAAAQATAQAQSAPISTQAASALQALAANAKAARAPNSDNAQPTEPTESKPAAPQAAGKTPQKTDFVAAGPAKDTALVRATPNEGAAPALTQGDVSPLPTAPQQQQIATTPDASAARAAPAAAQVGREIIRRFNGQSTQFDLRLDPPELGRVEVRLEVSRDHRVTATLTADSPQALVELARHARELQQSLQSAGLELAENGLSFDLRQGGEGARESFEARGGEDGTATATEDEIPIPTARARPVGFESWRGVRVDLML